MYSSRYISAGRMAVLSFALWLTGCFVVAEPLQEELRDLTRRRNYEFINVLEAAPVYLKVTSSRYDYRITGMQSLGSGLFVTELKPLKNHTIVVRDMLDIEIKKGVTNYTWSVEKIEGPDKLVVNATGEARVPPHEKDLTGLALSLNQNDSDDDGIIDREDPLIYNGDPELIELELAGPLRMPLKLEYDHDIIRIYEDKYKRFFHSEHGIAANKVDPSIKTLVKAEANQFVYAEGVRPGTTYLKVVGAGGYYDQLKITVLAVSD